MSINNNGQNWSQEKLIELSNNLSQAYNPGLNSAKSNNKADFWDTDKFIKMSKCLSSAYGVDF